jgi:hypothetical protein
MVVLTVKIERRAGQRRVVGVGPTGPFRPLAGPTMPGLGPDLAQALFIRFMQFVNSFPFNKNLGNPFEVLKFIENRIIIKKCKINFLGILVSRSWQ